MNHILDFLPGIKVDGFFVMQHNYRTRFLVRIGKQELNTYKYETCNFKKLFRALKPNRLSIQKSRNCTMTEISGAHDNRVYIGNTLLLGITNPECNSLENNEKECCFGETNQVSEADTSVGEQTKFKDVSISGFEIIQFATEGKISDCISNMGNDVIPYPITVGQNNTYFVPDLYEFIENRKIGEGVLSNSTKDSVNPYYYHDIKGGEKFFSKRISEGSHCYYEADDSEEEMVFEDEIDFEFEYCNGTNKY